MKLAALAIESPNPFESGIRIAAIGAALLGLAGFLAGFFGPMVLMPEANQGPLLGLFFIGPAGMIFGLCFGGLLGAWEPSRPKLIMNQLLMTAGICAIAVLAGIITLRF